MDATSQEVQSCGSSFSRRKLFTMPDDGHWSISRPAGGGGVDSAPPLQDFSIAQKRQQISIRNFQYLLRHQFGVSHQNYILPVWLLFLWVVRPPYFGLARGPITLPGPPILLMDRKDLNSSKTKQHK